MKILHINTKDTGGAANACLRIHQALLKKGIDSKVLFLNRIKNSPETYQFNYWDNTPNRLEAIKKGIKYFFYDRQLRHRVQTLPPQPEIFSFPSTIYDITNSHLYQEADIIQLNWVSGFLDEKTFFKKNKKPVIWRLADLYACGGGYHYEKGFPFDKYEKYINQNITSRKKYLAHSNLNLVPISRWMMEKANESPILKHYQKNLIQCGIEPDLYKPIDQILAKKFLGLPLDKKIISFGSERLSVPRKGAAMILEAINNIEDKNIFFCSFGENFIASDKIMNLGKINDQKLLTAIYSASDIFVTPSIEEAFGQTSIEALACGAALVAFPTGGGLEIIKDRQVGVLASDFSSNSLKEAILSAINFDWDRDYNREYVIRNFNIEDKADEYIKLYKSILNK